MTTPLDLIPAPVRDILVAHAGLTGKLELRLRAQDYNNRAPSAVTISSAGASTDSLWEMQFRAKDDSSFSGSNVTDNTVRGVVLKALHHLRGARLRSVDWHKQQERRVRRPEFKANHAGAALKATDDVQALARLLGEVEAAWPVVNDSDVVSDSARRGGD